MTELKFGRYEVEAEIGQGAMGKVYRALDPLSDRKVAIKTLKDDIVAQDKTGECVKRFQREARAAGGLSHPNIIKVFDVGENYYVMEYLEGIDLLTLLHEKGTFTLDETLSIVAPIADALAYSHERGVYHRDVKPANIMVFPDGRTIITDFGLAHLESSVMTTAGQFLGSPSYMSPEQVIGGELTSRADLYSLAVVTYEMLTGEKPFPGKNITTVVYKIVNTPPVPPHQLNARLPSEYEHIFAKALAKEPEQRFAEFSEFVSALNLEQFDRLELGGTEDEPTLVLDDDEETVELPIPAAEPGSSVTERKPKRRALMMPMMMSQQQKLIAAGAAAALAAFIGLFALFAPDPLAEGVVIETDPVEANIFLNGELLGISPIELPPMAFGAHDVRVEKEGFLPLEDRFELIAGAAIEPLVFALQSARISLFLESVPTGAAVTIDGEHSGQTPLEDVELEPGQHEIQVSRRGYNSWRRVLVAQAGESVDLVARLRARAVRTASKASAAASAPEAPAGLVELGPNDTPAKHISGRAPGYPPMARRLKQQGRVTIEFVVTEEGVPTELVVIESAGAILDKAVLDSLHKWRYEPAKRNNEPVRVKIRVRQHFKLTR